MGKMTRTQFVAAMKENIRKIEKGSFFFMDLEAGCIFANQHYGEVNIPLVTGAKLSVSLFAESEEEKDKKIEAVFEKIEYNRTSENLVEITLAFASLQAEHEELSDIDSITWKQMFVCWANEFEAARKDFDWDQNDYLEVIEKFAKYKIMEYAGLEEKDESSCKTDTR